MSVSRRALAAAVVARLQGVAHASGYRGEAGVDLDTGERAPVPTKPDGTVRPYWVLHTSPGAPGLDDDLAETAVSLDWTIQVTCAAGDPADLDALVDRLHPALHRWEPTLGDQVSVGRLAQLGDPGPAIRDDDVTPPRYFTPLLFRLTATT